MKKILLTLGLVFYFCTSAFATQYYIAKDFNGGDDGSAMCTLNLPCKTFTHVLPFLTADDVLNIRVGDYRDQQIDNGADLCPTCANGTSGHRIIVQAYQGEMVTLGHISASREYYYFYDIDIDGLNGTYWKAGGLLFSALHVRFQGLTRRVEIKNTWNDGVGAESFGLDAGDQELIHVNQHDSGYVATTGDCGVPTIPISHGAYWSANYGLIDDVWFHENHACTVGQDYGVQLYDGSFNSHPHNNVVRNSRFYNNHKCFTAFSGSYNNLFYNNECFNNSIGGVDAQTNGPNYWFNNTFYNNNGYCIQFFGSVNDIARNNICYLHTTPFIDSGTNTTISNSLTSNPNFTDPDNPDDTLKDFSVQSGSAAISNGLNLTSNPDGAPATFTTDRLLVGRHATNAWTIGATEFNGVAPSCTPAKIVILTQPSNATINSSIGSIIADIESSGNVRCTTATDTVTAAKTGGATWGTLNGTKVLAAINGVVIFDTLSVSSAGSGTITLTASGLTSAITNSITITTPIVTGCPTTRCTYYIDYANGSDANDGLSKATPWKRAPRMAGVASGTGPGYFGNDSGTGICDASPCNLSGYSFIFKGGVTIPKAAFFDGSHVRTWIISNYGTGNTVGTTAVYYGVDKTWYTGASWARPIIDWGGSASGPFCNVVDSNFGNNFMIQTSNAPYWKFDNFEMKGFYWDHTCGQGGWPWGMISHDVSRDNEFENLYFHGWSHEVQPTGHVNVSHANVTITSGDDIPTWSVGNYVAIHAIGADPVLTPSGTTFLIASRSDATHFVLDLTGKNDPGVQTGLEYTAIVQDQCNMLQGDTQGVDATSSLHDSVFDGSDTQDVADGFHHTSCFAHRGNPPIIYNNYFKNVVTAMDPTYGIAAYDNVCDTIGFDYVITFLGLHDQCYQNNASFNSYVFNNVAKNMQAGQIFFSGPVPNYTAWHWNNIIYTTGQSNGAFLCDNTSHNASYGKCEYIFNTLQVDAGATFGMGCGPTPPLTTDGCNYRNNHIISPTPATHHAQCTTNCLDDHNLITTLAAANTDGYSSATDPPFFPTHANGGTIGAGVNIQTFCNMGGYLSYLCYDSEAGVTYNELDHTITAPHRTGITRPAVPDVGAYQSVGASASFIISLTTCDQSATCAIPMVGTGTLWTNGTSVCSFISSSGITVNSTVVTDSTHATCSITIASNAAVGTRTIIMTTNSAIETDADALTITQPVVPGSTRGSSIGMRIAH